MVSKRDNRIVLWPEYFDIAVTRKAGRRVPKSLSIENPDVNKILKAAKTIGLDAYVETGCAYPRFWWRKSGRVLVAKPRRKKSRLLREIAEKLRIEKNKKGI
jgi:signal recognition particle subunit SRP19